MNRAIGAALGILVGISPAWADFVPDQAIVQVVPGESIDAINGDYGTAILDSIPTRGIYLLDIPDGWDEDAFEVFIEEDPRVAFAELNEEAEVPGGGATQSFYLAVDPSAYDGQYTWNQIDLTPAHDVTRGAGVIVAILDTGLDVGHRGLAGVTILAGADFVDNDGVPADVGDGLDTDGDELIDELVGHGTFQAGLIVAVAPEVTLLPVRVLNGDGDADIFRLIKGIFYAMDAGARVINMSCGTGVENDMLEIAINYAREAGVTLVASAGNAGVENPELLPFDMGGVIGVASSDDSDVKSDFSSWGGEVDLVAPGTAVVSMVPDDGYGEWDGTSGAAALVSAAAALVRAAFPDLNADEVETTLKGSAFNLDALNPDYAGQLGAGRIDLAAAVGAVSTPADLDGDGVVGLPDLLIVLSDWGLAGSPADLDGDGVVALGDLLIVLSHWG